MRYKILVLIIDVKQMQVKTRLLTSLPISVERWSGPGCRLTRERDHGSPV